MLEGWILALDLGSQKCMGQTAVGRAYVVSKVLVIRRNIRNPADATLLVAIGIPPKLLSLNFFSKLSNEGHGCGIVLALAKIS